MLLEAFRRGATPRRSTRARRSTRGSCASCSARARPRRAVRAASASTESVDTCAAEFAGRDAVLLLRLGAHAAPPRGRAAATGRAVVILGSGPNRIGQGIEFDYCCVHAAMTVRESRPRRGDGQLQPRDRLDRLRHLRPPVLRAADARGRARRRRGRAARGRDRPVRRPDAAASSPPGCEAAGRADPRHAASTRSTWPRTAAASATLLERLGLQGAAVRDGALAPRRRSRPRPSVGFPLLVRPSYVLGGRAMEIVYSRDGLRGLPRSARPATAAASEIFLDRFLENAIEVDVDALCDGEDVWIGGIMQHVEEAGIHSGDSRLRAAAALARPRHARRDPPSTTRGHRAGARRRRAWSTSSTPSHGGDAVRDRGQPARVADGAVRLQGDRPAAREARLPAHARRAARGPRRCPHDRCGGGHVSRQGGGAAVRPLRRRRRAARPGDALDRRGHGRRARLPDRVREGAGGGGRAAADEGTRVHHRHRLRQAAAASASPRRCTTSASGSSPRAAPRGRSARMGDPGRDASTRSATARRTCVDWIERGEVDLVINTPTGTGARTDGWEIRARRRRARASRASRPSRAAMAAARAIAAAAAREPPVVSLQELHATERRSHAHDSAPAHTACRRAVEVAHGKALQTRAFASSLSDRVLTLKLRWRSSHICAVGTPCRAL